MTLNILANNSVALILAAVTLLFGGIVAAIRLPGLKLLRWHQHFAAGIVRQQTSALAGIFCLGFFAVIVIDVIA